MASIIRLDYPGFLFSLLPSFYARDAETEPADSTRLLVTKKAKGRRQETDLYSARGDPSILVDEAERRIYPH
jgi:hypothetical protein